ncbi:hypothetical protein CPLU01_14255 [Colletotrichum plurivorum]|uniref:Uncharacterized protein n=1 Tax=Colletotrichum plurivorum TaxID=2175906 RepID=A0A8H6JLG0_9PEZI|nr:hypothetical protein CPLU01_14255 [Colletotrichum plurivorum]
MAVVACYNYYPLPLLAGSILRKGLPGKRAFSIILDLEDAGRIAAEYVREFAKAEGRSALLKEPVIMKNPASLSYDVFTWLNTYATWFVTATPMVFNVRDIEGYLHWLWKEAFAIEMSHFADPESLAVIYTETYIQAFKEKDQG